MSYDFTGEDYPATVSEKPFRGVVCARLEGTEEEINLSVARYLQRYPVERYATENWGDAKFHHWRSVRSTAAELVFELLLFRAEAPLAHP